MSFLTVSVLSTASHAERNPEWELAATITNSQFEIKKSSVTKVLNSLVFDSLTKTSGLDGQNWRSMDRYIVSCDGKFAAQLSAMSWNTELKDRNMWFDTRDTSVLAGTQRLVINTEFSNDLWFATSNFRTKIQSWCKGSPQGMKNIEASVASGKKDDGTVQTLVLSLDSLRINQKYREIWSAEYAVISTPIQHTDLTTGNKTQVVLDGKPQYQRSPDGSANSRARTRFQCKEKKMTTAQSVTYNSNGIVIESYAPNETQINQSWVEMVPGSIGEAKFNFVCAL